MVKSLIAIQRGWQLYGEVPHHLPGGPHINMVHHATFLTIDLWAALREKIPSQLPMVSTTNQRPHRVVTVQIAREGKPS
jgi:hypothetical protein